MKRLNLYEKISIGVSFITVITYAIIYSNINTIIPVEITNYISITASRKNALIPFLTIIPLLFTLFQIALVKTKSKLIKTEDFTKDENKKNSLFLLLNTIICTILCLLPIYFCYGNLNATYIIKFVPLFIGLLSILMSVLLYKDKYITVLNTFTKILGKKVSFISKTISLMYFIFGLDIILNYIIQDFDIGNILFSVGYQFFIIILFNLTSLIIYRKFLTMKK
ncbi:MAG: hypothetical protein ACK5HL_02660 [Bacilli bacterium]